MVYENVNKFERVSVFIDGSNFYHSTKNIRQQGYKIPFQDLIKELIGDRVFVNAFYYVALLDKEINFEKYEKHRKFLDTLKKISKFKVVLCNLEKIKTKDGNFVYVVKGDDVQLAHDFLMGAVDNLYDTAILVSGDADFLPLIKTVRMKYKKKVGNAYFRSTSSYKLRKACDFSINLYKIILGIINKKYEATVLSDDNTERLTE